ncbi:hypothetical protein A5649_09145 [Mycolicibacter heraklionensis]|uniref:Uncharacterized protein n=1 Tax=Mycolicibacter heraklionensis TaxID=512402 RepID=A0AA91ES58_9MYCO|nr:hypothetical protein [Mycolicibacter heraklionensis]OBK82414.1 hypothetical protein A5649_09145 [Mycolicibacter heraklionensis]
MPPPPWPAPPTDHPRNRTALVVQVFTLITAVAALVLAIVAFGRSTTPQTPTAAQRAAAQANLCDRYKLAARSVQIETKTPDNVALARISLANGAVMLETAAADPALDASARDAAHELALGYQDLTAMGTNGVVAESQFQEAMNAVNDRDRALKELCGD